VKALRTRSCGGRSVASSLALLAKEALSVEIDHGHAIEADGGLWSKTAMNAWLAMRPLDAIVPATRGYDHHVEYLQALPLYPSERTWKSVHGAGAFMQRWQDQCVPFWDPRRPEQRLMTRRSSVLRRLEPTVRPSASRAPSSA
jgi:hypothetical protein